jgi:acetyl esterase/lipase
VPSRDPREVLTRPAPPADLTLRYGPGPDHVLDVRLPAGRGARPLVVVLHGGFWMAEWDRAHAGPQSAGLAAAGYVVATPEYRRVGQDGGGWPGTFDDVARVVDALPALVGDALADRVDLGRTVLVGHSAGGHLALWAAARHRLPAASRWHRPEPPAVRGVVSLAGVTDLAMADRLHLGGDATRLLLGGPADERPERYAEADPAARLPLGVPVSLVHGTADEQVPVELSRRFAARAAAAGDPVGLTEIAGVGHFEVIDPLSSAWDAVLAAVAEQAR